MLEAPRRQLIINNGHTLEVGKAYHNQSTPTLIEHVIRNNEASLGNGGTILVNTGEHKGRSPKDKFIVDSSSISSQICWQNNQPLKKEKYFSLKSDLLEFLSSSTVYVQDLYACWDKQYRLKVRFIHSLAWHSVFVKSMFINPSPDDLKDFIPELTVINLPEFKANPSKHGTASETVIVTSFDDNLILIGSTKYAGENKKSVFSYLNFHLPLKGVLSMHCSANHSIDDPSDTALFFGLSGTGKTTLSNDPKRVLIGDDEHGWSGKGVFNLEGGIYAKTYGLDPKKEPEIYKATSTFGSVLENVVYDSYTRAINFDDKSLTENTRCAIPLKNFSNVSTKGCGNHPKNVFFLTCDAFGVLPPLSLLTPQQAFYHFLTGFTSKVAGTEEGITEPKPSFSTCFGKPFLPLFPHDYGKFFQEKINLHNTTCWLVNTGWIKGGYKEGKRISIKHTRALIDFVFTGDFIPEDFMIEKYFNLKIPKAVPSVPTKLLNPKLVWNDPSKYDQTATKLKEMFRKNFKQFETKVDQEALDFLL